MPLSTLFWRKPAAKIASRLDKQYQETLDNLLEGCQIIDFSWRYIYVNDAVVKQGQKTRSELLGHTMMEVYPGIEKTPVASLIRRCMETRCPYSLENEFTFPNGNKGWFKLNIEPVPQGVFILSIDMSDQRKLEELYSRLSAIVESTDDAIIGETLTGIVTHWNNGAEALYGYKKKEMIGTSSSILLPPEKKHEFKTLFQRIRVGEKITHFASQRICKMGELIDVSLAMAPIKDKSGTVTGVSEIAHDMTKELAIDRAKTEFVSFASHQLRTPLGIMRWYLEVLQDQKTGQLNQTQAKYLQEVAGANRRMIDLIQDLLNVSRIELNTLHARFQSVDLNQIAKRIIADLDREIRAKHFSFQTEFAEKLPKLQSDPSLIEIIFQNLLTNAFKYTPANGKISLKIAPAKGGVQIIVADSGYGIPKAVQSKIFSKLFRAENVVDKVSQGTGLGLYITKSIIEYLHGKIWFESTENKGTQFFVFLPTKSAIS